MWHRPALLHQRLVIVRFLRRQIEHQQTVHAGFRGGGDEFLHADAVDEVEINVENDRNLRLLADGGNGFQKLRRRGAGFQTALRGKLVHQTVGQRVAERHAEFQNVHARLVEGQSQFARGGQIRVARADIDDEAFFAVAFQRGELFNDAVHARGSFEFRVSSFTVRKLQETKASGTRHHLGSN